MPLYTKSSLTAPNDPFTNDKISSLAVKQNLVFDRIVKVIQPGMTTADLADIARGAASDIGIKFSFRSKHGFPEDISVCRNHEIMNGIPRRDAQIAAGDLLKISIGTSADMSAFCTQIWTIQVGAVKNPSEKSHLLLATMICLTKTSKICTPGTRISTIVTALDDLAKAEGIVLSRSFVGHLIGKEPMMLPQLVLPTGLIAQDYSLSEGTLISLLVLGHPTKPQEKLADNKWTVIEKQRMPSVAFSHMILISADGPKVLTSCY